MKKLSLLLVVVLMITAFMGCDDESGPGSLVLQPDAAEGKDAIVFSCIPCGYNTNNYGTKDEFSAIAWTNSGNNSIARALLQFDLSSIPAGATITSAKLSLFHITSGNGDHEGFNGAVLQKIAAEWDESTVTWNNQPATSAAGEIVIPASTNSTQDYPELDVTSLIQTLVDDKSKDFGFMLKLQNENPFRKLIFASSDHMTGLKRPKLEVKYNKD